ncbi:MAG: pilus assembly protein [Lachnospiraceae bacterium]|nr:pilus assembly protein [Lachnospiraceae bacterium]
MKKRKSGKFRKKVRGSLTVEASLSFPIFLFALFTFISIFRLIGAEYEVEQAVFSAARRITSFGSLADAAEDLFPDVDGIAGKIIDETVIGTAVRQELEDDVLDLVDGNIWGMSFSGSELFGDDKITIRCSYDLKVPILFLGESFGVPVCHSVTYRYFNGHDVPLILTEVSDEGGEEDNDDDSEYVYVTKTGSVYHTGNNCPALKISRHEMIYGSIESARNNNGGKYKPCERCASGKPPGVVYVTENGDKYHFKKDCSSLKRTVTRIKKEEALEKGYRECKRCAGKGATE